MRVHLRRAGNRLKNPRRETKNRRCFRRATKLLSFHDEILPPDALDRLSEKVRSDFQARTRTIRTRFTSYGNDSSGWVDTGARSGAIISIRRMAGGVRSVRKGDRATWLNGKGK